MVSQDPSSNHGHSTTATSDKGAPSWLRALLSADRLSDLRSVISVLRDLRRLIDAGMAVYAALGLPIWKHA